VFQENYPRIFNISPDIGKRYEFWAFMKAGMENTASWDILEVVVAASRKKFQKSNIARRLTERLVLVSVRHYAGGLTAQSANDGSYFNSRRIVS
jgi:hypothetical protein